MFRASVRLGDHDIFSTSDNVQPLEVEVDKRILHPKYDPSTFKNDIALLHLKRSVQYSRKIKILSIVFTIFNSIRYSSPTSTKNK